MAEDEIISAEATEQSSGPASASDDAAPAAPAVTPHSNETVPTPQLPAVMDDHQVPADSAIKAPESAPAEAVSPPVATGEGGTPAVPSASATESESQPAGPEFVAPPIAAVAPERPTQAPTPAAPAGAPNRRQRGPRTEEHKKSMLTPDQQVRWEELLEALHAKRSVEMRVLRKIKGGTILDYKGLDVFMPYSHWHLGAEFSDSSIDAVLGHMITVRVIEVSSPEKARIVASRRKILMEEKCAQMKEGQEVKGRISGVTSFGVFVDLGGIEGLIHISQLMSRRGMTAAEQLKVGDEVDVSVFRVDQKRGRVWLNLKGLMAGPWKEAAARHAVGTVHKAKVLEVRKYGAYVELEPGIEAFVHAQELSWTSRVRDVASVVHVGDEIDVKVLRVRENAQKIEVSLKQATENPWPMLALTYRRGTTCQGKVKEIHDKGAIIELPEEVDGFLPRSKMTPRGSHVPAPLQVGDQVQLRVVDVSAEKAFIILGLSTPRPERPRDERGDGQRREGPPPGHQPTLGELISEKIRRKLFHPRG